MVERHDEDGAGEGSDARRAFPKAMNVFGRQGSPTVTLALPFSRVDVNADDAAPLVARLAELTARLARVFESADVSDAIKGELNAIADAADALGLAPHDTRREV